MERKKGGRRKIERVKDDGVYTEKETGRKGKGIRGGWNWQREGGKEGYREGEEGRQRDREQPEAIANDAIVGGLAIVPSVLYETPIPSCDREAIASYIYIYILQGGRKIKQIIGR